MKVLLVNWQIEAVCGARRYVDELKAGFEKRPDTSVDAVTVDESLFRGQWDGTVPQEYDLYVFTDSVPQQWKEDQYGQWWMELFRQLSESIVFAVVHDVWWEEDREWILDVADEIDRVIAPQEPVERSLETLPITTELIRHPLDTDRMDVTDEKRRLIVSASQIYPRKNVDHLVREVPDLDHEVIVHSEATWEFERLTGDSDHGAPAYGDIWDRALDNGMRFVGITPTEKLWDHYRQARFVVDLQREPGWKHVINYTQLEPMLFGAVPIVYRDVVNPIMEDHALLVDDHADLPALIESVPDRRLRTMRRANAEFLVDNFEAEHIAGQFVDVAQGIGIGRTPTA